MELFRNSWEEENIDDKPLFGRSWTDDNDDPNCIPPLSIKQQLEQLTPEERVKLFAPYCKHCGKKVTECDKYF